MDIHYEDKLEHKRLVEFLEEVTLLLYERGFNELRFLIPYESYSKRELKTFLGITDGMAITRSNNEKVEDLIPFKQCYTFELEEILKTSIKSFVETACMKEILNDRVIDQTLCRYSVANLDNIIVYKSDDLYDIINFLLVKIKHE